MLSIQYIFDYLINEENTEQFSSMLMFDLPEIFKQSGVTIHRFFCTPRRSITLEWVNHCNVRKPMFDSKLKESILSMSPVASQVIRVDKDLMENKMHR